MKISEVRKLATTDRFIYWIKERETIRLKKESGTNQHLWTDDEILQTYRFCNVRRMDDKVSRWLLNNWYEPYKNHPYMLYAVAIARFFNLPSTLREITEFVFRTNGPPLWNEIIKRTRQLKDIQPVFNGAYIVRGGDGEDKIDGVINYFVRPLKDVMIDVSSIENTHARLRKSYGMGSFVAGQIVADLRWAVTGEWRDKNTWAPVGPGSARGLARLLYRKDEWEMIAKQFASRQTEWLDIFTENVLDSLAKELPEEISSRLEAHDYQNCLCEFDKYERVLAGKGKPKQFYKVKS